MPSCVVCGCVSSSKKHDPSIILHCFPKDPAKIKHWLEQTGKYGVDIDKMVLKVYLGKVHDSYRMCSLHFTHDSYRYDDYRRVLRKNAVPTIFNAKKPAVVPSLSGASTNIISGSSASSSERHIPSASPADSQKLSCYPALVTYRQVEPPKASPQPSIQQMILVPVPPQCVVFQACGINQKSNSVVGDRSVTIQQTATTKCETKQMQSALSAVSQQSAVPRPSTSSPWKVPASISSTCVQQRTSAVSGVSASSHGGQQEQLTPADLQESTTASTTLVQKPSSSVFTNSDLPVDSKATSPSTRTLSSTTTTSPIMSTSASSQISSTSGFDKHPLTAANEKKPCSTTVLPVSGNVSSTTQKSPTISSLAQKLTSSLAQKLPSIPIVCIPVKTPSSQTAIPSCLPPSKKRKLEENTSFLERSATSLNPNALPGSSISRTTSSEVFLSSRTPLVQTSWEKPYMVNKGVNTDHFTNRKSCCVSTENYYLRRNARTQTKILRKHRKIMCTLLLPDKPTKRFQSTVSCRGPKRFNDCTSSSSSGDDDDDDDDPCEMMESDDLDLVKPEVLSDSELEAYDPTSSDEKQAIHIKEENEAALSPALLKSTCSIPDFDTSTFTREPIIKTEENQFPISISQNDTHSVSQNSKVERLSSIKSEPLSPVCINPSSWETSAVQTEDELEDLNDATFSINELSEDEDESFLVPSDAEDEGDIKHVFQDLDSQGENLVEEEKYIVFESCLKKLIMMIPCTSKTKCMSPLTQYRKETIGSYLSIEVRCRSGHTSLLWESQPRQGYQPLGNVLLSAAVLFSGSSFLKSQHMFKLLNLKSIDKSTHHKNQFMYLFPTINHHWKEEQKAVVQDVQERPLRLAGDQQLDNPGFPAKYSIYSMMDVASKKICSFSVEPISPQVTLEGLEKIGFQKALDELQTMNANVKMIVTDRSAAIQEILKYNYPNIVHQLDLWHLSKSIGEEVLMAAKHKDCEILYQWVEAIRKHIWWSSRTCCKNPDLLIQKWKSVVHHVANVHEWDGDGDCKACPHPSLPEEAVSSTNWLEKDSAAHEQLKKLVENTGLLKDLKQLSFLCDTGELEIYHSTCLKYRPKTSHFFMDSVVARTQLAALDHNRNVQRVKQVVKNASSRDTLGNMTQKSEVSKGKKSWVIKALYEPSCQNFLFDIMNDVIALVKEEKTF